MKSAVPAASRAYWLCQLLGWGLYVGVTAFQLARMVPSARDIGEPLFAAAIGLASTHTLRRIVLAHRWLAHDVGGLALRVLLASGGVAAAHVLALSAVELGFFGDRPPSIVLTVAFAWMRWSLVFLVWNGIYFVHALVAERRERTRALRRSELAALKAQLNPHFLFNALNAIRSLIADEPAAAQDAVTRMARILRYTLAEKDDTVDLARELEVVEDYLALEQLRLGERLLVTRDIQATGRIPVMLLQGLVENAIKHGIARRVDGGTVAIRTSQVGDTLEIVVTNPRPTRRASTTEGTGLANMRERLRLLSDGRATLDLELDREETACARVRIPLRPGLS